MTKNKQQYLRKQKYYNSTNNLSNIEESYLIELEMNAIAEERMREYGY